MVKSTRKEEKTEEEIVEENRRKEEKKRKEEAERKDEERYLQRVRDLIEEDRKNNLAKAKVEIDGMIVLQTASLKESHIKPLAVNREKQKTENPAGFTVKIIHETKKQLHTLPDTTTVKDFKNILKSHFNIKNPKAYISTESEIDFQSPDILLKSLGVSDMDTIYVHNL